MYVCMYVCLYVFMYVCACRSGNFCCKNIFVACVNHEHKKHEIYFTMDDHYSQCILYTHFTVKLASFVGILDHKNILT